MQGRDKQSEKRVVHRLDKTNTKQSKEDQVSDAPHLGQEGMSFSDSGIVICNQKIIGSKS